MATTYQFKAVGQDGRVRTGSLHGESEKKVIAELRKQGLTPVYVGLQAQGKSELKLPKFNFGKRKDVLFFTQELSTLLNSGVPLDRALSITTELTTRAEFKAVVSDVLRTIKGGKSLADALGTKPEYFPEFYVNMVRAGEASGSLGAIFERLSEYEKTRDELKGYIVSSMVYPALLSLVGVATIVLMLYYVVPRFAAVFADSRMKIPTPTLILLEVSNIVRTYGVYALGTLVLGLAGFRQYIVTPAGKLWWHTLTLRIPVLGDALRKAQTSQFARAMGTLVANGVPLVQSLGISRAIMSNQKMSGTLEMVAQGVKRGEGLSVPISKAGAFPPLLAHLLSIGEETGRLDAMFMRAAEIYDGETRAAIKRFTSLFEPLIILLLGVAVGALILSMLLAITSINEVAV
ncbi:MAG: type II secretion system protein GspF [Candidatus Solibacter sp.]|nr:type II secretion system protein GspF [Candidatus Solibacter sp.]